MVDTQIKIVYKVKSILPVSLMRWVNYSWWAFTLGANKKLFYCSFDLSDGSCFLLCRFLWQEEQRVLRLDGSSPRRTKLGAEQRAKEEGFRVFGGRTLCPICVAELKAKRKKHWKIITTHSSELSPVKHTLGGRFSSFQEKIKNRLYNSM